MAIPPPAEPTTVVELDEEIEGEEIGSRNYRFSKIGEPVPINSTDSEYDAECLPIQPLAVSEHHRLLFVAHSHGFYVARTKDLMASAEEIKEKGTASSAQELSIVDVPLGKVSILTLSADDTLLAATVGSHLHFFEVSALLQKEQKPSYSISVDVSSCIKDMRWARKVAKLYVILSDHGKLYRGYGEGPPSYVMEGVDCVDWSVRGNFVAMAQSNTISILSSEFKEKLSFLLPFQSVIGDSGVKQVIKVDSIRWFRPDCIAVGCFQLNDESEEENYIVHVITSKGRRLTDAASKPVVLAFNNIFMDFSSDAVPSRNGPHLFLSYLDLHGLAFIAATNLSQHVGLLCWSKDSGKNEASITEILNDAWTLYIDSQGNGEENVVLGLCVDKFSQNENVKFTLGDVESEVSPSCVILCLTIDGRISIFHFASAADAVPSAENASSDEENDAAQLLSKHELSLISSGGVEETKENFSKSESCEVGRIEVQKSDSKVSITNNLSTSFNVNLGSREQIATGITEQKPLVNSQTLKVNEPEKPLSELSNQDSTAEKKSISEVKSSTASSSGKKVDDFSGQLRSNYPALTGNLEQLGKVPSANLPSAWSLTKSHAVLGAPKPSDGRLYIRSGEVENSDKPTTSTGEGSRQSLPAYPVSQMPLRDHVASGKPFPSGTKDFNASSPPVGMPYSAQNASKLFGNVEQMAKKLDNLLEGIEGEGGFRDSSITSLTNFVIELEDDIWALSDRCRMSRGLIDEQLRGVQLLLDKTVQVLVRKVYMEGIFKQATDSRYWELWNRQKLSSELELKRRHILELNQELTNKLIELEMHFNSLELHKFGENGGRQRNQRVMQNWSGNYRQIPSLHSLHNTMNAQLSAAEQLSGHLSKQMALLRAESSGHDLKKQLFESVGLSYAGCPEISPVRDTACITPPNKEHLIASGSTSSKVHTRRHQANFPKSYEPESARRRRDSLDQSWASFEPSKTTVKRMLKENYVKGSASQSLSNPDKQGSLRLQKRPEVAHSEPHIVSATSSNHYRSGGTAEIPEEQFSDGFRRTTGSLVKGMQVSSNRSFPTGPSPYRSEIRMTQNSELGALKLTDENLKSSTPFTGKNDSLAASETGSMQQSDTSFYSLPSMSMGVHEESLLSTSVLTECPDHFKVGFTKSTAWDQKNTHVVSGSPLSNSKTPLTPASALTSGPSLSDKSIFTKNSKETSIPDTKLQSAFSSSLGSGNTLSSFSSFVSKSRSTTLFPASRSSSGASVVAKQDISQPSISVPSTLSFSSTLPSSTPESSFSSVSPSTIDKSESLKSTFDNPFGTHTSVVNEESKPQKVVEVQASANQPGLAIPASDLKLGLSSPFTTTELSTNSNTGTQIEICGSLKSLSAFTSVGESQKPSETLDILRTAPLSSEGVGDSVKDVHLDASGEEEMEEEAPETNQTTQFALGHFDGFGIGSTPNSATPKSNPFGVSILNKDTNLATSSYTMSNPSGELFRPASFNLQLPQKPQPLQPSTAINFSGGFTSTNSGQASAVSGFGQPANIGAGQQALGSVLGSFGQSRQIGSGLPGSNVAPASGFGSGFMGVSAGGFGGGGFASASKGGGFASLAAGGGGFSAVGMAGGGFAAAATSGGGFASAATAGGGFAAAATAGGGFAAAATAEGGFAAAATAGGGFAAAATAGGGFSAAATAGGGFSAVASAGVGFSSSAMSAPSGGGFGAFSNQQAGGGFSAFGGGSGSVGPPSGVFTQMRK